MAKKQNRFARKADQTRRINGRHVHAKRGEHLNWDLAVLRWYLASNPDADEEFFERACKGNPDLAGVLKLVRAGALSGSANGNYLASHA